jgi:hypothetical protein
MKSLPNKLYIFYLAVVGSLIIILQLYFRLFKSKNSYSLDSLRDHISPLDLLLSLSFMFLQVVTILSIFYFFYKQIYNIHHTSKIVLYISQIVDHIYWKPLEYIHDQVAPDLPGSGRLIMGLAHFLSTGNQPLRYKVYRSMYLLFDYLPQVLCSIIFFTEIVIWNQLYYFLYAMVLFLIPLMYRIYLKLCDSFVTRNEPGFLNRLHIVPKGERDIHGVYLRWDFSLKAKYVSEQQYLNQYIKDYLALQSIVAHLRQIRNSMAFYYPYITLFTSSLYLTASIYRLMYILF